MSSHLKGPLLALIWDSPAKDAMENTKKHAENDNQSGRKNGRILGGREDLGKA